MGWQFPGHADTNLVRIVADGEDRYAGFWCELSLTVATSR